ncbi:MAG: GDSL-type esterase/lipase family protein [Verrucomicrobiales bacterium]
MTTYRPRLATLALAILGLAVWTTSSFAQFAFEKGDRISLIGNSLADRFQHDGWVETLIQSKAADKELVFRNLGFAGDQVKNRPRNAGFPPPEEYLKLCETDVIFAFFGYNESFGGEEGVDKFKKELGAMVDGYRGQKFNGESAPRIVLFSPIAAEENRNANVPDGKVHNQRLALYTEATKAVAEEKGVTFVDLYHPTKELFASAQAPLTLNGVHLSAEGNQRLAEIIAKALLGEEVSASPSLEKLRQAVLDKNFHWYNRYRATDGNDVWGGRSKLSFVDGQTNAQVLQHELTMLDVMAANRDPRIWAVAKGGDLKVDDSNVPPPVPVKTNVGGGSKSSNAQKEGSTKYISGAEQMEKLKVAEGFELNLFADEKMFPELVNPVQMAVDTKGRLWCAAWKTYPKWEPTTEMEDRLLILPDENRDGKADKVITFAKVHNPTGFEFWNGGVLVASAPDIIFLKDTDGDDVADLRIHYLQGIDSSDTHHTANGFVYGPDGAIYYQRGVFNVSNVETPWASPHQSGTSGLYRFDPRRYTFGLHCGNSPNPHGISFDRWGYQYITDGTGGNAFQVVMKGNGFDKRKLLNKTVRPVPASGVISSQQFPEENQQNFMICNTIGFLGIKQYKLDRNAETGEVWGTEVPDLVVADDKDPLARNFRPSDVEFGDDGALYISDWHNVIIGHMQHNVRDPNRDHQHGRIYRMTAKGRPLQAHVAIDGQPIPALLENLKHPVDGVRYRTRIELSERKTDEVIAAAQAWVKQFDAQDAGECHHMLEALWLHQQHNVKNPDLLTALLTAADPHVRNAAKVVQHHWFTVDHTRGGKEMVVAEKENDWSPTVPVDPAAEQILIKTVVEKMSYDKKEITVKAGKKVQLTFANPDFMPHNLIVVQPGAVQEIAMQAQELGAEGFKVGFIPKNDKIIAHTDMLDNGKHQTIEFTAPSKPGKYEYVCSFPGHWVLMRGVMKVVK